MTQYINKDALVTEIEKRERRLDIDSPHGIGAMVELECLKDIIGTLEVKEVDLEKLGEIARHLIAIKEHVEDMQLYKEEWLMLEKLGYPERFKAQKEE